MALNPGTRFGPYEIAGQIGVGGMGEVYRATDTTLDREVAVKVMPESFAADTERVARFEREAKTLASLNHANIAQIFGLEKSGDSTAIVMELIEGPTLADRIKDGPIPPDEALGIAMQIAAALEAAHDAHVVHRDLKPANVKLKADGTVKVLDFGIAKAIDVHAVSGQAEQMTTPAVTQTGVILGTAAYMSPEQARGKLVDERTDIWAFGCLLFEMLTGQPAFGGEDVMATLARVIDRATDLSSIPKTITPAVRHTIKLCLEKNPNRRISDIRDVRLALEGTFESDLSEFAAETVAQPRSRVMPLVATSVAVTAIVAGFAGFSLRPPPLADPVNRFNYDIPEGHSLRFPQTPALDFSRDGRFFVYNSTDGIYLRSLDQLGARLIFGTEGQEFTTPFLSADGMSVAYFALPNELRRIAVSGGASQVVTNQVGPPFGAHWESGDTILYGQGAGIFRISANGGAPELLISAEEGERLYGPQLLPDEDSLLFSTSLGAWDEGQVAVQSLATGERRVLVSGGSDARYLPTGHLIYALDDVLFAIAFDVDDLSVSGAAVPVVQGVMRASGDVTPAANYAVSDDGTLVYLSGSAATASNDVVWVDDTGREEQLGLTCNCLDPSLSPDGTRVAVRVGIAEGDIWVWSLAQATFTRLTFEDGSESAPLWSPDSTRIAYSAPDGVYWQRADGTGTIERLLEGSNLVPWAWTADGELIFTDGSGGEFDIAAAPVDGDGGRRSLLATPFTEARPALSPDGRWLAYESTESGRAEIYVRPYPDVENGKWQISAAGGSEPRWSQDGRTLYFVGSEDVMRVDVESTDTAFVFQTPEPAFDRRPYVWVGTPRRFDVSGDGRLLVQKNAASATGSAAPRFVIVTHWTDELQRLVPTE